MTDELSPDVLRALRAEAYRPPVRLTASALAERIDVDRRARRREVSLFVALATMTAVLVVAVVSTTLLPRPLNNASGASPSPACAESAATKHGSWWYEMGGPHAFFNIDPGTLTATNAAATALLIVRFDPAPASPNDISIRAIRSGSVDRIDGVLNSPMDPGNIAHFDEPAPALPGGWYLFELDVPSPGCWTVDATVRGVVVGSATFSVAPGSPDPPASTGGAIFSVRGKAVWCGSFGGCAYELELEGEGRHELLKLGAIPAPDTEPETPLEDRRYLIELPTPISPLGPGSYRATFTAFMLSDEFTGGEQARGPQFAACVITFDIGETDSAVVIEPTFSTNDCSAKATFVVNTGHPH